MHKCRSTLFSLLWAISPFTWPQSSLCHGKVFLFFNYHTYSFSFWLTPLRNVSPKAIYVAITPPASVVKWRELSGRLLKRSTQQQQQQQLEKLLWFFPAADRHSPDVFVPVWISSVWLQVSGFPPHRPCVATLLHPNCGNSGRGRSASVHAAVPLPPV